MKVVVVGGHTRNIGKTSVMAGLIRELKSLAWTAVKITQYGRGTFSQDEGPRECTPTGQAFVLTEEANPRARGDTCRFLAAGARRSFWLRVRQGQLAAALPSLTEALRADAYVIIESNSILGFLKPAVYVVVLDRGRRDFKASARQFLERADALVPVGPPLDPRAAGARERPAARSSGGQGVFWRAGAWPDILTRALEQKPVFPVAAPDYQNPDLSRFIRQNLRDPEAEIHLSNFSHSSQT